MKSAARPVSSYQPQMDGLRAVAILGVLANHFALDIPKAFQYGPLGVSFFFVLTGYFITMSLLKARYQAAGETSSLWKAVPFFYVERAIRIVPALWMFLAMGVLLATPSMSASWPWHALFASNIHIVKLGYWPEDTAHLWSISTQEQFYLLWPLVVLFSPRRWLPWILSVLILAAFAFRYSCIVAGASPLTRWVLLPGNLDNFATGGLVALLKYSGFLVRPRRLLWLGIPAFLLLVGTRFMRLIPQDVPWIAVIECLENVFLAWLVAATLKGFPGPVGRLLSWGPVVYIGTITYGIYLYHMLVLELSLRWGPSWLQASPRPFPEFLVLAVAAIAVAAVSWHAVETPFLRLKAWIRQRRLRPRTNPEPANGLLERP